ncbi:hypothetical protein N0V83_000116 [Neocucurbitaria cava]|uniref:F-box domain-containing protein n=1 Tax=Neocucurbitaria cava TaxID=798079 RepID=A0A9W8YG49_9PLEO|nr:hypothetical protein N0V83_000116 [Neocucurbitaria cava]
MQFCDKSPPAPKSSAYVTEIMDTISTNLDRDDLPQAAEVCREWRDRVPLWYETSTPCVEELDPHFDEPCEAYKEQEKEFDKLRTSLSAKHDIPFPREVTRDLSIIVRRDDFTYDGLPVLRAMRGVDAEVFQNVEDEQRTGFEEDPPEYRTLCVRQGFQRVRIPNGWPVGLREIYCIICDGFHTRFRFENLHPMLRFLESLTVCFRGHGSILRLTIGTIAEYRAPKSCYEHYREEMLKFAHYLRYATNLATADTFGNHLATRPLITKLVTTARPKPNGEPNEDCEYYSVIQDTEGLKLKVVVLFLLKAFRSHLAMRIEKEFKDMGGKINREPHLLAAFPGDEWETYKTNFEKEIPGMYREGVEAVNEIMNGTKGWEPIVWDNLGDEPLREVAEPSIPQSPKQSGGA